MEHLDMIVREWMAARQRESELRAKVRAAVVAACDSGMSESAAAHAAGVDRQTVRAWRGK